MFRRAHPDSLCDLLRKPTSALAKTTLDSLCNTTNPKVVKVMKPLREKLCTAGGGPEGPLHKETTLSEIMRARRCFFPPEADMYFVCAQKTNITLSKEFSLDVFSSYFKYKQWAQYFPVINSCSPERPVCPFLAMDKLASFF